jgi:uncharacterized membrane protein
LGALSASDGLQETVFHWVELASLAIEVVAVTIIVAAVAYGTVRYLHYVLVQRGPADDGGYKRFKHTLARALLLGLELLVAADIVETVALESTLKSVAVLGLLVLIRTFLSWSLIVEMEGRWPWQPASASGAETEDEV